VIELAVGLRVQLVHDGHVRVEAVRSGGLGGDGPHDRAGLLENNTLRRVDDPHPLTELLRSADHLGRRLEYERGLIAASGSAVDLRSLLAVANERVESETGSERGLGVLT